MDNRAPRVLLTGATGFIGSAVRAALGDAVVRCLVRRPGTAGGIVGDLTEPATLRGICDGTDVIVHAASYVGADPDECARVNHAGTRHLLAEAARSGVRRIVQVSTAAVYGHGPHRDLPEEARDPAPVSPASASRAAAEREVRGYGGVVLRPHLVYGPGDRWVVPSLARLLSALPGLPGGGRPLMSMVAVTDLARLVAALATRPAPPGTLYHANHPEPVSVRAVGAALHRLFGLPIPDGDLPAGTPLPPGLSPRHLELVSVDHWYASHRVWAETGLRPRAAFPDGLDAAWYPSLHQG